VSQDPYALAFYKLGDTTYAARSNEFGYANYELIPTPQIAVDPLTEITNQLKKIEQLRQLGSSLDAKITPLLDAEQQQKFQVLREELRRRLLETMGSEVLHKLESEAKEKL
jgi:hypothetical protein